MRIVDAEPIEKEVQRSIDYLKSHADKMGCADFVNSMAAMCTLKSILREAPTIGTNWISTEDRMPESPFGCLLIVWDSSITGGDDFLNYLPYFAGWDGEQWNDADGEQVPFEVAYWMKLPSIPEERGADNEN